MDSTTIDSKELISQLIPVQLSLIQSGDINLMIESMKRFVAELGNKDTDKQHNMWKLLVPLFEGCVKGIQHRRWDTNCLVGMNLERMQAETVDDERLGFILDSLIIKNEEMIRLYDNEQTLNTQQHFGSILLKCCLILGDGTRLTKVVASIVPHVCSSMDWYASNSPIEISTIITLSQYPLVRVINLKCRPDRWKNAVTQAQRHKLFIVLAVSTLAYNNCTYWGSHAFSGLDCNHLEFEQRIQSEIDNAGDSEKETVDFVSTHWRPRDLQAFDKHARNDDSLVRASVSERACALSHASSWFGVHNSLIEMSDVFSELESKSSLHEMDPKWILQLFRISGFARGPAMLSNNEDMLPSPVCVILEDDALVVDRFNERLESILAELPRDFHYCSIGYSRPRNAPLVPYASQIAIPTCLWYCTGYILSLAGAKHLISSLPIVGPVDSWIGLKMFSNWDNVFGERIGVGVTTKVTLDKDSYVPTRKDLGIIMKFRAFAALTPLCSQKLHWSASTESADKNRAKWRDRDTDVEYSGSK